MSDGRELRLEGVATLAQIDEGGVEAARELDEVRLLEFDVACAGGFYVKERDSQRYRKLLVKPIPTHRSRLSHYGKR